MVGSTIKLIVNSMSVVWGAEQITAADLLAVMLFAEVWLLVG
jgi:hypothetical protein